MPQTEQTDVGGRFLWYELLTSDPAGAQEFYTGIVDWDTRQWSAGDQPYTMWLNGERPIGGIMEMPEDALEQGARPHWLAYVGTPDVDSTVSRARELGATVMLEPTSIPEVGRMAVLADPQGAIFAVYAPEGEPPAAPDDPGAGDFSWHELATGDWREALDFYGDLFGWEETDTHDMGEEMGIYQMYGQGDATYGGMYDLPEGAPHWMLYVTVGDLDGCAERVEEQGGQVLNGPMEVPGGDRVAQCRDPQGATFALHEPAG